MQARYLYFTEPARFDTQPDYNAALIGEIEYYVEGESGSSFTFKPYVRLELQEGGDNLFDIREAMYLTYGDEWELRAGVGKVFWGVTEAVHLVDIINQTDVREDVGREEKLGPADGAWFAAARLGHVGVIPAAVFSRTAAA